MRVVYIAAGSGLTYCGACARDALLLRGLIERGLDVEAIPLYTPLYLDDQGLATTRVFMGGINLLLAQISSWFSCTPALLRRFLSHERLLRLAASCSLETRPSKLGALTVSVLKGAQGPQRADVEELLEHLRRQTRPEVICLTNSLLSGLAPVLKRCFSVPIVCSLQGEDAFIDELGEPHRSQAVELLRHNCTHIDAFVAPCPAQQQSMLSLLKVSPDRIRVIGPAVDRSVYRPPALRQSEPVVIGYLSVITWRKGLDLLVDAFLKLAPEQSSLELHIAGKVLDRSFYKQLRRKLAAASLLERCVFYGELTLPQKVEFLQRCNLFCLPSRIAESRGLAVLEALACGVPAVVPDGGIFPELAGCGVELFNSADPAALGGALRRSLGKLPALAQQAGSLSERFSAAAMVASMAQLLATLPAPSAARP